MKGAMMRDKKVRKRDENREERQGKMEEKLQVEERRGDEKRQRV